MERSTGSEDNSTRPRRHWTRERYATVDDVRNKTCWICREDQSAETERRRWIHPCECTLVAHETCLLTWIRLQSPTSDNLKCPQCKTAFEIVSSESKSLSLLEGLYRQVSRLARMSSIIVIGGGVYTMSTLYGYYATRWLLGSSVAHMLLGGPDPPQWSVLSYIYLPLTPTILMLSSSKLFDGLCWFIPLLLSHPGYDYATHDVGMHFSDAFTYPPSPPMILICLPIFRSFYRKAHTKLAVWLVKSHLHTPGAQIGENNQQAEDPLPEDERDIVQGGMAAALDRGEQVTVTLDAVARLFMGSLILPPVSALAGEGLKLVSSYSSMLRTFLGVRSDPTSATTLMDFIGIGFGVPALRVRSYADFDPIWWRNVLGLSLFVMTRDAISLWRRYLRAKEKQSRRVLDKPFVKVDYSELDLVQ